MPWFRRRSEVTDAKLAIGEAERQRAQAHSQSSRVDRITAQVHEQTQRAAELAEDALQVQREFSRRLRRGITRRTV